MFGFSYENIVAGHLIFFASLMGAFIAINIFKMAVAYVKDSEVKYTSFFGLNDVDDGEELSIYTFVGALLLTFASMAWIIAWPVVLVYILLRGLRKMVRTSKILKEHINDKSLHNR